MNPLELFSLKNKIAIVTGASKGIGFTIANAFEQLGARTYGIARSTKPENAHNFFYKSIDVREQKNLDQFVLEIIKEHGRIDILVNAAGISIQEKQNDEDEMERFKNTLEINLVGAYAMIQAVSSIMKKNKSGSIINITSIGSELGFPGNPGYGASKGGLKQMTKFLAIDLGNFGIRVNSVGPGYIRTSMTEASYSNPEKKEQRQSRMILPRWGTTEDLVGPIVFLASEASAYVTGAEIFVDGGWTAKGL